MLSKTGNWRPAKRLRTAVIAFSPAFLSKVINSIPSAPSSNLCSVVPITQLMWVFGNAACSVRTTGSVWQQSPIADRRSMQMASGTDGKSRDIALTKQFLNSEGAFIVYDDAKVSQFNPRWFEPEAWPDAERTAGKAGGRGAAIFISPPETPPAESQWVLRHYYRGGLPGKIIDDRFVWTGAEGTRSWREWQLLVMIHAQGLPAPAPVAARYVRHGLFYTADLITERLPDVLNDPAGTHMSNLENLAHR